MAWKPKKTWWFTQHKIGWRMDPHMALPPPHLRLERKRGAKPVSVEAVNRAKRR